MFLGVDGVSDGLLGDLEQILIQREPPFYRFRILDADHSALGTAQVIHKDNLDAEIIPGFVEKTGQHPHTVEQIASSHTVCEYCFRPPYSRCAPYSPFSMLWSWEWFPRSLEMRSHVEGEILLMFALSADFPNPLSAKPIQQKRRSARES